MQTGEGRDRAPDYYFLISSIDPQGLIQELSEYDNDWDDGFAVAADLAPLWVEGDFEPDVISGGFRSNGPVRIGVTKSFGGSSTPIASVYGSVIYDSDSIRVDGELTALGTDGEPRAIFRGTFEIERGSAVASSIVTDRSLLEIAGADVEVEGLSFSREGVRVQGRMTLPGLLGGDQLLFTPGAELVLNGRDVTFPAGQGFPSSLRLGFQDLNLSVAEPSLKYNKFTDGLELRGKVSLKVKDRTAVADLTGANHVAYDPNNGLSVVGEASVTGIGLPLPAGISLDTVKLGYDSNLERLVGTVVLKGPTNATGASRTFEGVVEFLGQEFDAIALTADDLGIPLLNGWFLQSVGGKLKNFGPTNPAPVEIQGPVGISYGPHVVVDLPAEMGGGFSGYLFHAMGQATVAMDGKVVLAGPMAVIGDAGEGRGVATGSVGFTADSNARTFSFPATFQALGGIVAGTASFSGDANERALTVYGSGTLRLPALAGWFAGRVLQNTTIQAHLTPVAAESYYAIWREFDVTGLPNVRAAIGVRLGLDGTVTMLDATNLPPTPISAATDIAAAAASTGGGSFAVAPSTPHVLMSASWVESAGATPAFRIDGPGGAVYTEADLGGGKIAIVPELSGDRMLTVVVAAPAAGQRSLSLTTPTGLGMVSSAAFAGVVRPRVTFATPTGVVEGGNVAIQFASADAPVGTAVSLFQDTDGAGFDGVLIPGRHNASDSFEWDTGKLPEGAHHVYAVLTAPGVAPVMTYAPGVVRVTWSGPQSPYRNRPFAVGPNTVTQIEAEDFDKGGESIAYHDLDPVNLGGTYRTSDRVDLRRTTDVGGGYRISDAEAGEWVEYTLDVAVGGTYNVSIRMLASQAGGRVHLEADGSDISGPVTLSGVNNAWSTANCIVDLAAGVHVLRLSFDSNGGTSGVTATGVNWIRIAGTSVTAPPIVSSIVVADGAVQRAVVRQVSATFDKPVTLAPGAFVLAGPNDAALSPAVTASWAPVGTDGRAWLVTFSGSAVTSGMLPKGNYELRAVAAKVTAVDGGAAMAADYVLPFFVMPGDANGDRSANIADFGIMQNNYNRPGTPAQGDFNGDGQVNIADWAVLQNNYNVTLAPPAAPSGGSPIAAAPVAPMVPTGSPTPTATVTPAQTPVPANAVPTVSMRRTGTATRAPASIRLNATASDRDGRVRRVEFYRGDVKIGEDAAAPYTLLLTGVAAGTHVFSARAVDDKGGVGTSAPLTVTLAPAVTTPPQQQRPAAVRPAPDAAPAAQAPKGVAAALLTSDAEKSAQGEQLQR